MNTRLIILRGNFEIDNKFVTSKQSQGIIDKARTVKMVLIFCMPRIELKPQRRPSFCHK